MGREIRFRAWDKDNLRMVYQTEMGTIPYTLYLNSTKAGIHLWHYGACGTCVDANIMQFTGLRDCNGKEIYEGDIVKHDLGKGVVDYENGSFTFGSDAAPFKMIGVTLKSPEVIGNIYENPELLNEQ